MLVQVTDIVDQCIDKFRLDRSMHQKPAVVGEMRQLIGIHLIDMPGRARARRWFSQFGRSVQSAGSVTSGRNEPGIGRPPSRRVAANRL